MENEVGKKGVLFRAGTARNQTRCDSSLTRHTNEKDAQ